jgi:hypothetical protein
VSSVQLPGVNLSWCESEWKGVAGGIREMGLALYNWRDLDAGRNSGILS